jgi:Ca2+-binding RTX toxin-like protein
MPTFTGDAGDNLIDRSLSAVADSIDGLGGNDTLLAGSSIDTLVGGTGNDTLNGGSGADRLRGEDGDDTLAGVAGNDTADGGAGFDTLFGGGGNDSLLGGDDDDSLLGHDGLDSLNGGSGRDTLDGGDRDDFLYGGQSNDSLIGGAGKDSLLGGNSNDTALGGSGNDTLDGAAGLDSLWGDDGNDTLVGGAGADAIDGGNGTDVAVFAGKVDDYEITKVYDTVLVRDLEPGIDGNDGTDVLAGAEYLQFADGTVPLGGAGNDSLLGSNSNDKAFGGSGNDTLNGGGGGLDSLWGDSGDDALVGGAGNDAIDGGYGNDVAVFAGKAADYEITRVYDTVFVRDLEPGIDGDDGTDVVTGVEHLQFADGTVPVPPLSALDLATPLGASRGATFSGAHTDDGSGLRVSGAGDVNGDGFGDVAVSAELLRRAYVVFGTAEGFGTPGLDLGSLTSSQGFAVDGPAIFGLSAGDVNGDGLDDLIWGAANANTAYVIFGNAAGLDQGMSLATMLPSEGFAIHGIDAYDSTGFQVNSGGDVNGDGIDDLIVGAHFADGPNNQRFGAGESYVIFGRNAALGENIDLSTLTPDKGFVIHGAEPYSHSGVAVSIAGDMNGDGFDDIIIKSFIEAYIILGTDAGFGSSLDLANLTSAQGVVIMGVSSHTGDLSSAGDINGDGFADLVLGAGETYVIFGTDEGFGASIDLRNLSSTQGFMISGDHSGSSSRSAGDVNGDGFDDLIIGAASSNSIGNARPNAGDVYVIYGKAEGFGTHLDLATLTPDQGFVIYGRHAGDYLGQSVDSAGDLNDDGFDDLVVGAYQADANGKLDAGATYIIYGSDFRGDDVAQLGSSGADSLVGTSAGEVLVAAQGNDTVNGAGGDDVVQGAGGNDSINGGGGADTLDGGSGQDALQGGTGDDTLRGEGGDDRLNGQAGDDRLLGGAGDDVFVIKSGNGTDTIVDFVPGAAGGDVIDLTGVGSAINSFADVQANATAVGSSTEIDLGGGEKLVLLAFQPSELVASDFLI